MHGAPLQEENCIVRLFTVVHVMPEIHACGEMQRQLWRGKPRQPQLCTHSTHQPCEIDPPKVRLAACSPAFTDRKGSAPITALTLHA